MTQLFGYMHWYWSLVSCKIVVACSALQSDKQKVKKLCSTTHKISSL